MRAAKITLIVFLMLCFSCATVPITGRSQLMMMSKAEEERIGEGAFYNFIIPFRNQGKIIFSNDPRPEMRKYVSRAYRVLDRIMNATGWKWEYKWKCAVIDEPKIRLMKPFSLARDSAKL